MGRPVIKYGSFVGPSDVTSTMIAEMYPAATTTWMSTVVTTYLTPFPIRTGLGSTSNTGIYKLRVNGNDVMEFRSQGYVSLEPNVMVIPWGDGILFSAGERVHWTFSSVAAMYASAAFIGVSA